MASGVGLLLVCDIGVSAVSDAPSTGVGSSFWISSIRLRQ